MSHTLYRRGTTESLSSDFILFAMTAKGFNDVGSATVLRTFLKILDKYEHVNMGDMKTGSRYLVDKKTIMDNVADTSIVHAVFTDRQELKKALKDLKEADLGVSVNVSGMVEHVHEITQEIGQDRHTVEYSVGIKGKLSKLPESELLEVTTMCGHGMVSQHMVRKMLIDIKRNRRTTKEAAEFLATPCVCGVFNPRRAEALLEELVDIWCLDEA